MTFLVVISSKMEVLKDKKGDLNARNSKSTLQENGQED
jgi:hypothetical protein